MSCVYHLQSAAANVCKIKETKPSGSWLSAFEWVGVDFQHLSRHLKHATSSTQKVAEESFVSRTTWSADHFSAYISHLVEQKLDRFIQVSVAPTSSPLDFCHPFLYYWSNLYLLILSIFIAPNFLVKSLILQMIFKSISRFDFELPG